MIKLTKGPAPAWLDSKKIEELTQNFKDNGKSVWHIPELKEALLKTSFGKCVFCECTLGEESKYMEVEHFKYKDKYDDDVMKWENLLPACRRCNGQKRSHDVVLDPIVNPYEDEPSVNFSLKNYRLKYKTPKGKESIEVLDLNNSSRVVLSRFRIGEQLQEALLIACERLKTFKENPRTASRNRFLSIFENLLKEAQPEAAYAATTATLLHEDEAYTELVLEAKSLNIWTEELEALHSASMTLALR